MKRTLVFVAATLAMAIPALAAPIFIPTGPKQYIPQPPIVTPRPDLVTPRPDLVTPRPDLVETTPGYFVTTGTSSPADKAVLSSACTMGVIGQPPEVKVLQPNVDANCTPLSIASTGTGYQVAPVTTVTPQDPLITPQDPIITPQDPIITPQPDLCRQPGISIPGGFGYRDC